MHKLKKHDLFDITIFMDKKKFKIHLLPLAGGAAFPPLLFVALLLYCWLFWPDRGPAPCFYGVNGFL